MPDFFSLKVKHGSGENIGFLEISLGVKIGNVYSFVAGKRVELNGNWQTIVWDNKILFKDNGIESYDAIYFNFSVGSSKDSCKVSSVDTLKDFTAIDDTLGNEVIDFGFTTGIETVNNALPKTYLLSQNYPNPFNPTTTIKFAIPQQGNVKLEVYDITGKLINTLINKDMNSGSYTVTWDGKNSSGQHVGSGVYLYRIQVADNFNAAKKMIMMK